MQPLWSPVVASGVNRSRIGKAHIPGNRTETAAVGCHRLPKAAHGKEGVDGSSPSEGFVKTPASETVLFASLATFRSGDVHETSTAPNVNYSAALQSLSVSAFPLPRAASI
jgi:hypothetical protein